MPNDPLDLLLGKRLKQLREALGWSPERLGEGIGVSEAQILRYEAGESRLSTSRLFRISRQLQVSPESFYDEIAQLDLDGLLDGRPGADGEAEPGTRPDERLLRGLIEGGDAS
ncbi:MULTISPECIES: helix-turn-helix domain-containing protein [unclassified Aureimonas]|uniref:helix-turn-helix domain-containing protein n=1 Tax=unclassified Aureimonas TaxID=2615206 RepID=UPI00071F13F1|nr:MULTISPECIES: helix-turn-helix transcriptional regulator [unclassified Aureimonas]ALN74502.1 hypothetical protein M673_17365 [Aureimonas sp. AU20]